MLMSKHALSLYKRMVFSVLVLAFPAAGETDTKVSVHDTREMPKVGVQRTIKEVVGHRARAIMNLGQRELIELSSGRLSFLQEMLTAPEQLGKDLPRLADIKIGKTTLPAALRKNKSAEQQFMVIGTILRNYVKQQRPELTNNELPGRIGAFWITEIIYAVVQNFSGPAFELAHEIPLLKSGEWASPAQNAKQQAIFKLEAMREPILSVTFTCERAISNVNDATQADKILITESTIYFHLQSGEVTFGFKYMLDGKGSMRAFKAMPKPCCIA